mmetsp:Transcript_99093/g.275838  ORF Transcript_99093/g.275838 Transcript_99093/m.275838 type:complete len:280 (+) Transcript_99093:193-1032(+)
MPDGTRRTSIARRLVTTQCGARSSREPHLQGGRRLAVRRRLPVRRGTRGRRGRVRRRGRAAGRIGPRGGGAGGDGVPHGRALRHRVALGLLRVGRHRGGAHGRRRQEQVALGEGLAPGAGQQLQDGVEDVHHDGDVAGGLDVAAARARVGDGGCAGAVLRLARGLAVAHAVKRADGHDGEDHAGDREAGAAGVAAPEPLQHVAVALLRAHVAAVRDAEQDEAEQAGDVAARNADDDVDEGERGDHGGHVHDLAHQLRRLRVLDRNSINHHRSRGKAAHG